MVDRMMITAQLALFKLRERLMEGLREERGALNTIEIILLVVVVIVIAGTLSELLGGWITKLGQQMETFINGADGTTPSK